MKKSFKLENLDCANCAAKIESEVKKIDGVIDVSVNFMGQKISIEADSLAFDEIIKKVAKVVSKIDSDTNLIY